MNPMKFLRMPPGGRQRLLRVSVAAAVLAVAGGVLLSVLPTDSARTQQPQAEAAAPKRPERPGTNVAVLELRPQSFAVHKSYVGHLEPWERITLRSEIEGLVETVHVSEGQKVSRGEEVVNISTNRLRLQRDLAQKEFELAQANFERDERQYAGNLISPAQLDQSRNRRDTARLNLELAQVELDKSVVRSPIDGAVKTVAVDEGEYVGKAQLLAEVLHTRRLRAVINVPELQIAQVQAGESVQVALDALPERRFGGTVHQIGLEADRQSRSFPVEVAIENPQGTMRAGMLARVRVEVGAYTDAVLIPRYAILEREDARVVFVVEQGQARERRVELGVTVGDHAQVLAGLQVGDPLIVRGQQLVSAGAPVTVRERTEQQPFSPPDRPR